MFVKRKFQLFIINIICNLIDDKSELVYIVDSE